MSSVLIAFMTCNKSLAMTRQCSLSVTISCQGQTGSGISSLCFSHKRTARFAMSAGMTVIGKEKEQEASKADITQ